MTRRHLIVLLLIAIPLALLALIPAYAATTCSPAPTAGPDVITCSGSGYPDGGSVAMGEGDDRITVVAGAVANNLRGDGGNDILTNNGTAGALAGGAGNDTITNNGATGGSHDGDGGDDVLIHNGTFTQGGVGMDGGSGRDTLYYNGKAPYVLGGADNDRVIIGPNAQSTGKIDGGGGTDTICFNIAGAQGNVPAAPIVGPTDVTLNGQTFTVASFEVVSFDCVTPSGGTAGAGGRGDGPPVPPDDRVNWQMGDLNAVVYLRTDDDGDPALHIYGVNENGAGFFLFRVTRADLEPYADATAYVTLLAGQTPRAPVAVYRLVSGEVQVSIGPDFEGKVYDIVYDGESFTWTGYSAWNVND